MFKWDIKSATEPLLSTSTAYSWSRNDFPVLLTVDVWAAFITRRFSIFFSSKVVKSNGSNFEVELYTCFAHTAQKWNTNSTILFLEMSYQKAQNVLGLQTKHNFVVFWRKCNSGHCYSMQMLDPLDGCCGITWVYSGMSQGTKCISFNAL